MLFWILAAIILAIATLITCLPLFRQKTGWTPIALALVFALPAGALMLYKDVGTPEALDLARTPKTAAHTSGQANGQANAQASQAEIDELVGNLRARLDETPESLDGWILLARTLKTMEQYPQALEALETAKRIAPEDPFVTVELVEAQIFMSGTGQISEEMITQLQSALDQDPGQQKAMWLMGIAAAQAGEDEAAISYWETLLEQVEPDSPVRQSVQEQIAAAQQRLGLPMDSGATVPPALPVDSVAEPVADPVEQPAVQQAPLPVVEQPEKDIAQSAGWTGFDLQVTGSSAMPPQLPQSAVLFVVIRGPGAAVGPPIGVRRIIGPTLPMEMTISDRDSMIKERQISSESEVQLQARVSFSGSPGARSGDWQSSPVTVSLKSAKSVELKIDQQVE